jgi:uncharacterized membrane protein
VLSTLLHTLAERPYVASFLAAFLVISWVNRGWQRTLLMLAIGTFLGWASEAASIRWGFPYGDYTFDAQQLDGELVLAGVPLWSSVSFAFIAYASYETAAVLGLPVRWLSTAWLMTWADVVLDPIALRGDRWFLGQFYAYETDGFYFGVPLSNFTGWFLVGALIVILYELACRLLPPPPLRAPHLGPGLYYGIVAFISIVGIAIGEIRIVIVGLLLHAPILVGLVRKIAVSERKSEDASAPTGR